MDRYTTATAATSMNAQVLGMTSFQYSPTKLQLQQVTEVAVSAVAEVTVQKRGTPLPLADMTNSSALTAYMPKRTLACSLCQMARTLKTKTISFST